MLSLYKLEIFAVVVQAGSFSSAASRLYMTQPAVSQHIQDLEGRLGTTLFVRGRRGVVLTPAGEMLHDYTRRILRLVAEAESAVTDVHNLESSQIAIGATPGVSVYLLPDWIGSFRERYPNLSVAVQTDVTTQIITSVLAQRLDIGIVEGELEGIERSGLGSLVLQPIDMRLIVGPEHAWHSRASIQLADLQAQPFITRQPGSRTRIWIDAVLKQYDITPHIIAEFDNPEAIKQAIMANMGITILPEYAIRSEVQQQRLYTLPLEDAVLRRNLKLIWNSNQPYKPVTRALLAHLSERFRQISALL